MTRANTSDTSSLLRPTAALGAWSAAWLTGVCSPDAVLDTLGDIAARHRLVTDVDAENDSDELNSDESGAVGSSPDTGTADILTLLRSAKFLELRLPAPGDPQGIRPGPVARSVLRAGEVLLITESDDEAPTLLYPGRLTAGRLSWHVSHFDDPAAPLTDNSVAGAAHGLKEATRTAADVLSGLPSMSSGAADSLRAELAAATARRMITLPPHENPRIDNLLASAARIDAILDVAGARRTTFGLTARQGEGGDAQVLQLRAITRHAVTVAVNAVITGYFGRA